jgi:inositol phosphorylceramide mannosyltransferase catalytic subunit
MTPTAPVARTVHLVWVGPPAPVHVEALRDRLLTFDPHLEVRIWDDDALRTLQHRALFDTERNPAGRADIARYEILLAHGGLYLDADFDVHASIEPVFEALDRHGLVVARQARTVYANGFLGARAGHPLLQALVDGIPNTYRWMKGLSVPAVTGPHYLSEGLFTYLRQGGTFYELPQHAVYPWYSDEPPLPATDIPDTVLLSHEWAAMRTTWTDPSGTPTATRAITVRDRRRLTGRTLRARAASSPTAHTTIARIEHLRTTLTPTAWLTRAIDPTPTTRHPLGPTDTRIERTFAVHAARALRGSAVFVDIDPASALPTIAATRSLDRPGRTLTITGPDNPLTHTLETTSWSDPSVRCTTHHIRTTSWTDHTPTRITTRGTPLTARTVDATTPPNTPVTTDGPDLTTLIAGLPRIDLLRATGHTITPDLAHTLHTMLTRHRLAHLAITIDPTSTTPGTRHAIDLLHTLDTDGHHLTITPWLIDPRGRTWRQHLRVATRPFTLTTRRP